MKDIKGYEGLYAVTSCGKVWSYKTNKFLKPIDDCYGYLRVNFGRKHFRIHRLVAEAYLENPNNYKQINHKDEDKTNNCINNLEWCDAKYNNAYGTHRERVMIKNQKYYPVRCKENNKIYYNADDISNDLNIERKRIQTHISDVIKGTRKSICGYHFEEVV